MTPSRTEILAGAAFGLCLVLAALLLRQGVGGSFFFDDLPNLQGLEQIQDDPGLASALHYVVTGLSSPLGRPLTLATFAAQYADWPHPSPFQVVNIALHLVGGCLLFWALLRLARLLQLSPARGAVLAVVTASWWLLAPLQASAVLYVVQRMAVLSGVLMLLGLLLYLIGRAQYAAGRRLRGLAWCTAALAVGAGLGTLAKENAALLPAGLLALELTLLAHLRRDRLWRAWTLVFLGIPTLAVLAYLAQIVIDPSGYAVREFTLGQRALTETRVLAGYLVKLALPSISSVRLLYDDFPVSTGLLSPPTTLLATLAWVAALAGAVRWRTRAPWFSFAVLWFLAHHLIESTVVPLELAFEHRNYVAIVGPLAAAVWYALRLLEQPAAQRLRPVLVAGFAAYFAFVGVALGFTADLWGRSSTMVRLWASAQPESRRAQMGAAEDYLAKGEFGPAAVILARAMERWPGDLLFPLTFVQMGCVIDGAPVPDLQHFRTAAARYHGQSMAAISLLGRLVWLAENGHCDRYSAQEWFELLDVVDAIPEFARQRRNTLILRSRIAFAAGAPLAAADYLDQAIALGGPSREMLLMGTNLALQHGRLDRARRYAALAEHLPGGPLRGWIGRETAQELRARIERHVADHAREQGS